MRRRNPNTRKRFWLDISNVETPWVILTIVSASALILSPLMFLGLMLDHNNAYKAQQNVVTAISTIPNIDERKSFATSLLTEYNRGVDIKSLDDNQFAAEISHTAFTGTNPHPTMSHMGWGSTYFAVWLYNITRVIMVLYTIMLSGIYLYVCKDKRYFLADLPWKKLWTYGFLAQVPLLWPALPVSLWRKHRDDKRILAHDQHTARDDINTRAILLSQGKGGAFDNDIDGARTLYHALRNSSWRTYVETRPGHIKVELSELKGLMSDLSQELKDAQKRRGKLQAEMVKIEALDLEKLEPISDEAIDKEFARIMALPGVRGIRPLEKGFRLLVDASIKYNGAVYDLGSWELDLEPGSRVKAVNIRSGSKPSWSGSYPPYLLSSGRFCFGGRDKEVGDHLDYGQLLEAASLAVECLNSVNEGDKEKIPTALQLISEE